MGVLKEPAWLARYLRLMREEHFSDAFGVIAESFRQATGVLAPGKDVAPAMGPAESRDDRHSLFQTWFQTEVVLWP
jgi:hypothetical protein